MSRCKKTLKIKWHTNSEDTKLQQRRAEDIWKHTPELRGPAKRVQTPPESFNLFFSKEMINNFVEYNNQNIKPAIERFPVVFDESDKYKLFHLVDSNDIFKVPFKNKWPFEAIAFFGPKILILVPKLLMSSKIY